MKKVLASLLTVILLFTACTPALADIEAKDSLQFSERKNVSIIVDGVEKKMTPLVSDSGYLLLPVFQLLPALGVLVDEGVVTINDDIININTSKMFIEMKIDSNIAEVNGQKIAMPISPISYNNNVYIPARFTSELLNKKIVWDSKTNAVIIRDFSEYMNSKAILEKSATEMKKLSKFEMLFSYLTYIRAGDLPVKSLGYNVDMKLDQDQERLYYRSTTLNDGDTSTYEYYAINDVIYALMEGDSQWIQKKTNNEFHQLMSENDYSSFIQTFDDRTYAGLAVDESLSNDEDIVLSGKWFIDNFGIGNNEGVTYKPFNISFKIDRYSYYLKSAEIRYTYDQVISGIDCSTDCYASINFSNFDSDQQINLPQSAYINRNDNLVIMGSDIMKNFTGQISDTYKSTKPKISMKILGGGSDLGVLSVENKTSDIAMSTLRIPSKYLKELGLQQYTAGYQGIAVIVNPENGVSKLTDTQLRMIFSGKISNWRNVGGKDAPINLLSLAKESNEYNIYTEYLNEGKLTESDNDNSSMISPLAYSNYTNTQMVDAVSKDANAIGFVPFGYLNDSVSALSINDVSASEKTIKDGSYPISSPLTYITKGDAIGWIKDFIDYILSDKGQKMIRANKFIGVQ